MIQKILNLKLKKLYSVFWRSTEGEEYLLLKSADAADPQNLTSGWHLLSRPCCSIRDSKCCLHLQIFLTYLSANCETPWQLLYRQASDYLKFTFYT